MWVNEQEQHFNNSTRHMALHGLPRMLSRNHGICFSKGARRVCQKGDRTLKQTNSIMSPKETVTVGTNRRFFIRKEKPTLVTNKQKDVSFISAQAKAICS